MADLESFFAKKDKKKKSKKVEIVPDELLKKIELDTHGLIDIGYDSTGDQPQKVQTSSSNAHKDDEEWDEFEREKEIDLSSLKIQNLGEMEKERQEVEDQEEMQKAVEESKSTMKWKIKRKEESSDDEEDEVEETPAQPAAESGDQSTTTAAAAAAANNNNNNNQEEAKAPETAPPAKQKYIPPALRGVTSQDIRSTPASGIVLDKISTKRTTGRYQQIDVNSTDQFPSLGMAVQNAANSKNYAGAQDTSGTFTSVRRGARNMQESTPDQKGLSTSNKYSVLKSRTNGYAAE